MGAKRESRRFGFTMQRLESLPAPASGRACYHDTGCPHLVLRVTPNGVKSFCWYKWLAGRPVRVRLGTFPELSVDAARKAADKVSREVAIGGNPQETRRDKRRELTLAGVWDSWIEHAKQRKRSWPEDDRLWGKFLRAWGPRRLSTITQADIAALHARVGKGSGRYQANRVLALLSAMLNKARELGFRGENPCRGVSKFKEESRDRFLQADELRAFFGALEAEPSPLMRDFFALCLLTGARRANTQGMKWQDVDLEHALWRIPGAVAKAGVSVVVPLVSGAVEILRRRLAESDGSPWVFPGRGKTGHLVEPKAAWRALLRRAGLSGVRLHDLRRTFGSWQALTGASLPVIGKSLGHTQPSTTSIYARLTIEPVRESVTKATRAMFGAANGKSPAEPEPSAVDNGEGEGHE